MEGRVQEGALPLLQQLEGMGEHGKLPHRFLGQSPKNQCVISQEINVFFFF